MDKNYSKPTMNLVMSLSKERIFISGELICLVEVNNLYYGRLAEDCLSVSHSGTLDADHCDGLLSSDDKLEI
jgi:hypothetical protein